MSEWISVKDNIPPLRTSILVLAKEGYYWREVHGPRDERVLKEYVGSFYDASEGFKNLKPKITFYVDCGCSGREYDKAELEVCFWMALPQLPEVSDECDERRNE